MPDSVEVVQLSGDALDWVRLMLLAQLAIGVVVIVLLTALLVVVMWRGA